MSDVELSVRSERDARKLAEILNGFEAKSVWIYSKDEFLLRSCLWFFKNAILRYKPYHALRYLYHKLFNRVRQIFHTYNVKQNVIAYVYPPWRILVTDPLGYNYFYIGGLERIYQKLEANVVPDAKEIEVIVREW